jgi:hypothetical protein
MNNLFELFLPRATKQELIDAAIWLQADSAILYAIAREYRDDGKDWLAGRVQDSAAHSARLSRECCDLAATH